MENFVVSARKFRPGTFDTVIGQNAITVTLKNSIRQNQLAQAFLFCGPRGVGKTTCARILAKTINCQNITENIEPCNECESCRSFNASASFNIFELDAASNNSVDDIRSLIDQVRIPPQTGKYKVYIIDEVHMLSAQAFNAFLKTLEEPPAYAKFILATTEKHKVLPTILSRCQIFDFRRISVEDIIHQLQYVAESQSIEAEEEALQVIAQKSDGSMRDGLSIFDQIVSFTGKSVTYAKVIENLNVLDYEYFFRFTDMILNMDHSSALMLVNEVLESGFDGQHFLAGFSVHLRNLLIGQDTATVKLLEVSDSIKNRYIEQAKRCPASFLAKSLETCNQYDLNYRISNNKRLHIEILTVQLCGLSQLKPGDSNNKNEIAKKAPEVAQIKIDPSVPLTSPTISKPVKPAPVTATTAIGANGRSLGSISIKAIHENISNGKKETEEETDPAGGRTNQFDQEALERTWITYAEEFHKESPSLYTTLIKRTPQLGENYQVNYIVDTKFQEEQLNSKKQEIINYLKKNLQNSLIGLFIQVTEHTREDKPYTSVDKFKKIAGNNPAILELKDSLDLELDI
ncbi:MAG: DNA polymerase III subunit gamma/tau [Bacteroidales bacterium]